MIKKILITSLAFTVSACGFTPMNAPSNIGDTSSLRNIRVQLIESERISDREAGYFVQQHLFDRIGTNNGQHTLQIEPTASRRSYGLSSNDVASRYDMAVTVEYVLSDNVTGKTLDKGEVRAVSTFGSSRDPYARISAEKTATDQVSREAADRLMVRVASYYKDPDRKTRELEAREQERLANIERVLRERGYTGDPDQYDLEELGLENP